MPFVVGVAFRPVTKIYHFDASGFEDLEAGDRVIVETSRGRTMGTVVVPPRQVSTAGAGGALKPVIRRATAWDLVQSDQMAHKEADALAICRERAAALGLKMKVIRVEYAYDGSHVVVYFSAEQRVDFRHLVHDLAQVLQAHVEMRQVGVRDEAKFIGGYGRCGRALCCASWLRDFTPVSIKMAKLQDLPLNTSEVSGVCSRLLCCLSYENDFYEEARKQMPRINSVLMTPQGPGKVKQVHVLANSVTVQVEGPNGTRLMIDVPVAEAAPMETKTETGGAPQKTDLVEEEVPDEVDTSGQPGEKAPAAGLRTRAADKGAVAGQPRRSRGRRRRR